LIGWGDNFAGLFILQEMFRWAEFKWEEFWCRNVEMCPCIFIELFSWDILSLCLGIGKIGDFEQSNIGTYGCCLGIHEGRCGIRKAWKSFGTD
jgi:hypothetical protein